MVVETAIPACDDDVIANVLVLLDFVLFCCAASRPPINFLSKELRAHAILAFSEQPVNDGEFLILLCCGCCCSGVCAVILTGTVHESLNDDDRMICDGVER